MEEFSSVDEKVRIFERLMSGDSLELKPNFNEFSSKETIATTTVTTTSRGTGSSGDSKQMEYYISGRNPLLSFYRDSPSADMPSDVSSVSDYDRYGMRSGSSMTNLSRFSSSDIMTRCSYHTNQLRVEMSNLRDELLVMIKRNKTVANATHRQSSQISTLSGDILHSNRMYTMLQTSTLLSENKISTPYRYHNIQDIDESLSNLDNKDLHSFHKDFVINSTFRNDNY